MNVVWAFESEVASDQNTLSESLDFGPSQMKFCLWKLSLAGRSCYEGLELKMVSYRDLLDSYIKWGHEWVIRWIARASKEDAVNLIEREVFRVDFMAALKSWLEVTIEWFRY